GTTGPCEPDQPCPLPSKREPQGTPLDRRPNSVERALAIHLAGDARLHDRVRRSQRLRWPQETRIRSTSKNGCEAVDAERHLEHQFVETVVPRSGDDLSPLTRQR